MQKWHHSNILSDVCPHPAHMSSITEKVSSYQGEHANHGSRVELCAGACRASLGTFPAVCRGLWRLGVDDATLDAVMAHDNRRGAPPRRYSGMHCLCFRACARASPALRMHCQLMHGGVRAVMTKCDMQGHKRITLQSDNCSQHITRRGSRVEAFALSAGTFKKSRQELSELGEVFVRGCGQSFCP